MENEKFFAFESPPLGLGAMYAVHLRFVGKLVVYFPLVIIELLSLYAFVLSQCTRFTDGRTEERLYDHLDRVAFNAAR